MDDFSRHKENIKEFALSTISNYQRMYHILSDELDRENINEHALYSYHSMAFASLMTMKSYYLQNDILSHEEFDRFFEKAGQFSREFTSSRKTNHSMQWTFGYYNELAEAYNDLAALLDLNPVTVSE